MELLGFGLAMGMAGLGIGIVGGKAMESMARQPESAGGIRTAMVIAVAFIEAIAIYALLVSLIMAVK